MSAVNSLAARVAELQIPISQLATLGRALLSLIDGIGSVEDKTTRHYLNEISLISRLVEDVAERTAKDLDAVESDAYLLEARA